MTKLGSFYEGILGGGKEVFRFQEDGTGGFNAPNVRTRTFGCICLWRL